jgi:hypothetical protein
VRNNSNLKGKSGMRGSLPEDRERERERERDDVVESIVSSHATGKSVLANDSMAISLR